MQHLLERLDTLHGIRAPADVPGADAGAMARGYVERLQRRAPAAAESLLPLVQRIEAISAELAGLEEDAVLVHGDLMAGNMLDQGPRLVDWEYAQAADPSWDWACLLSYYPALEPWAERLMEGKGDAQGRLTLQRERFELLNRLWQRAYPPMI